MAETLIKIKLFPDKYSKKVIDHVMAEALIIQFTEDGYLANAAKTRRMMMNREKN